MQIQPGIAFTIDQLGAALERAQATVGQLGARVDELEAENARLQSMLQASAPKTSAPKTEESMT